MTLVIVIQPTTTVPSQKNPFEQPKEGLLVVDGRVNGKAVGILIDSGAVLSHISLDFCQRIGIPVQEEKHAGIMANKVEQRLNSTISHVTISIGPYTETMRLVANPQIHDVILGKSGARTTRLY